MGHNDIYSVDSYKNILDIRYTPYSNDYFTGGFSDSGAWVCFTLPSEDNWVNGFCGPFELDHRLWISDALLQVGFTPNVKTEMFKPVEVSYAPGELYMSSSSDMGNIQQRLFFVDRYTALWSLRSGNAESLCSQWLVEWYKTGSTDGSCPFYDPLHRRIVYCHILIRF
ncbi:hypothetical protein NXX53_03215 [Bacteroides salyersiae]|nr:hypothetical protein [Bacteroides salyersiae]